MLFVGTRGNGKEVTFSQAILNPAASFGGLYAPKTLPYLNLKELKDDDYKTVASKVLKLFDLDLKEELIEQALERYNSFDTPQIVPIVEVDNNLYISELYHGPTRAFKDMALQPFGYILSKLAQERGENYLILAATSGDTGPATLETFKNQPNIKVVCLYPAGGTSDVQRLQMVTEDGENLKVIGIRGNFDDAQTALKALLSSEKFNQTLQEKGIKLSAANSVNFGRIIFQIIYHIYSYLKVAPSLKEKINLIIPSGNFGNALGAYYAKKMGVPIEKILIASNANNILTEFIKTGRYDLRDRKLLKTCSPAMDILKSSNVERVLFDKFGAKRTRELMEDLNSKGYYQLTPSELKSLQEDFDANFTTDEEAKEVIKKFVEEKGYLMDPHTATTIKLYNPNKINVAYSTAEWTKFAPTVLEALTQKQGVRDLEALEEISTRLNIPIPKQIKQLFQKPIVHDLVVDKEEIEKEVVQFL